MKKIKDIHELIELVENNVVIYHEIACNKCEFHQIRIYQSTLIELMKLIADEKLWIN
jgi:hypothetical protein